ncbi:MAG: hypothetical protein ACYCSQ_00285 [bacterium]
MKLLENDKILLSISQSLAEIATQITYMNIIKALESEDRIGSLKDRIGCYREFLNDIVSGKKPDLTKF